MKNQKERDLPREIKCNPSRKVCKAILARMSFLQEIREAKKVYIWTGTRYAQVTKVEAVQVVLAMNNPLRVFTVHARMYIKKY